VYHLLNPIGFAAGQLAVFQGASEAPISGSIRAERATLKNSQLAAARTASPAAHFERNEAQGI
jgi:hypothetical protein